MQADFSTGDQYWETCSFYFYESYVVANMAGVGSDRSHSEVQTDIDPGKDEAGQGTPPFNHGPGVTF